MVKQLDLEGVPMDLLNFRTYASTVADVDFNRTEQNTSPLYYPLRPAE